jgi:hypothetical protein
MDKLEERARQDRRASNMVWNAARGHSFAPDYRAFDGAGNAEPYMNCCIGAVHRYFDYPVLEKLMAELRPMGSGEALLDLLWLGLEGAGYVREVPDRPVLAPLRRAYAEKMLSLSPRRRDRTEPEGVAALHWAQVLGRDVPATERQRALLLALDFTGLDAEGVAARMREIGERYYAASPRDAAGRRGFKLPAWMNFGLNDAEGGFFSAIRRNEGLEDDKTERKDLRRSRRNLFGSRGAVGTPTERAYVAGCFGRSSVSPARLQSIEKRLCAGSHENCFLHFTRGEQVVSGDLPRDALLQQSSALTQRDKNRADYRAHYARNENAVCRLTDLIRNSLLLRQEDDCVRSSAGVLQANRVWRVSAVGDDKVFDRIRRGDNGEMSVDILLDASASQTYRQEQVSTQGYIIAEALTRCGIPVRVSSFCTAGGCTVLRLYRDYHEKTKNAAVFDYCAAGWNRDGLALRAVGSMMASSGADDKLLILLSDASPNDDRRVGGVKGFSRAYRGSAGVDDVAREAKALRESGISLVCVYTGEDMDLPGALKIYGRGLARIKSVDQFAATVGGVICNELRYF